MPILILILFIPVFWVLIIRPQQQQRRAHQEAVASLEVGDRVMTVGGLIGTLAAVEPDTVRLDVGDGLELTLGRTFVRQRLDVDTLVPEERDAVAEGRGTPAAPAAPDAPEAAEAPRRRATEEDVA
ncbi:MAG: preprotein translocase subunit YajC [Acidimicrobiales bacterium]